MTLFFRAYGTVGRPDKVATEGIGADRSRIGVSSYTWPEHL